MKHIIVPIEVVLVNKVSGERWKKQQVDGTLIDDPPYSMFRWLHDIICSDPGLRQERADRAAVHASLDAFESAKAGDIVEIEDAHHKRLAQLVEKLPANLGYTAPALAQFWTFEEEWIEAKSSSSAAETRRSQNFPRLDGTPV